MLFWSLYLYVSSTSRFRYSRLFCLCGIKFQCFFFIDDVIMHNTSRGFIIGAKSGGFPFASALIVPVRVGGLSYGDYNQRGLSNYIRRWGWHILMFVVGITGRSRLVLYQQLTLFGMKVWISNYINIQLWFATSHPYHNFNVYLYWWKLKTSPVRIVQNKHISGSTCDTHIGVIRNKRICWMRSNTRKRRNATWLREWYERDINRFQTRKG